MLPLEIIDRVFKISFGSSTATGFALDIDDKQYLITAKHVVESLKTDADIKIFHGGEWKSLSVILVGHGEVDVSVLAPQKQLTDAKMVLGTATGGFHIAQEVFFAGFPLGLDAQNIESAFPAPLVKRAIISGKQPGGGFGYPFYLDGHNNPGFSGGPVYLRIPSQPAFMVSMVISSYTAVRDDVIDEHGNPTNLYVEQNSGIIQAYNIANAINLIRANPIGIEAKSL